MKYVQIAAVTCLVAATLAPLACKSRSNGGSSFLAAGSSVVTETGKLGKYVDLDGKGKTENYIQYTVDKTGFLEVNISLSTDSQQGFPKPVFVALYSPDDQQTPIASGNIPVDPQSPQYLDGVINVNATKTGDYFLLVRHEQQLESANDSASMSMRVRTARPAASKVLNWGDYYNSFEIYDGNSIAFQLITPNILAEMNFSVSVSSPSDKVFSQSSNLACNNCGGEMEVIAANGAALKIPIIFSGKDGSISGGMQFDSGTYTFKNVLTGVPAGSMVRVDFNSQPMQNNSGQAFKLGSPLGFLNLQFDSSAKRMAVKGPGDFGFMIDSDRNSEAQVDLSFHISRIFNKATSQTPLADAKIQLVDPSGTGLVSLDMKNSDSYWNGQLVADLLANPQYKATITVDGIDAADIINLDGSLAVSNLTIPDGGPAMSQFQDLGAVTITPPANYLADMNVTTQPHTPAVTPIDLASKSVLDGMELIRNTYHVRLPKGTPRGSTNSIDASTIEACLGNEAAHWSDLIIHYYCQYGEARSCYTGTIRNKAQKIGGDTTLSQQDKIKKLSTIRIESYNECAATASNNREWAWLVQNQANVFQYVMNSQTFAFNMEQQQALINKFYRINNPADKTECNEKRPRRAIDPTDGTHCLPTKIFPRAMQAAGR